MKAVLLSVAALVAIGVAAGVTFRSDAEPAAGSPTPMLTPVAFEPADTNSGPVVIELFTSQGCSSCPPANDLAVQWAKDPSLLVITRAVTYWDQLGWKDTLGREANTALQRAYAAKGLGGAGVYTPQMVVNGGDGAVGSRASEIREIAARGHKATAPQIIHSRAANGDLMLSISGKVGQMAGVSLLALSSHERVSVLRGENAGRVQDFANVVRDEIPVGIWQGGAQSYTIPAAALKVAGADRFAVLVQEPKAGAILAGRMLAF